MADFKRLKKGLGPLGFLADLLSIGTANWGLIVSAIIAFGAGLWNDAFKFVADPRTQTIGGVFLWSLWSYIALSILYRLHNGIRTVAVVDYSHGIVVETIGLAYDKDSDNALQFYVSIRNVTSGPMQIEVHDFRLVVGGRTIPDSPIITMIVPRFGSKGIISGIFGKDAVKDRAEGTASLLLHYGPPEGPLVRKFKLRAKLVVRIGDQIGVGNNIETEEDAPL